MGKSILHVVNIYFVLPYFIGDQFLFFQNKGYKQHVICSPSEELDDYSRVMRFKYVEIPILREFSVLQDVKSLIRICKYIKKNKIDIVVGHTPKGALLSMIAAYFMGVPKRIYFRHGLVYETSRGLKKFILIWIERITAAFASKIVCVSPYLYNKSIVDNLNNRSKQIVLGSGTCGGIDTALKFNPDNIQNQKLLDLQNSLNIAPEDFVIGFSGRIVKDKGIVELVNAFKNIRSNRKVKLLLVGGYETRDQLPASTLDDIRNCDDIIVTGFVNRDEIEYYYALMKLFVLPSYREGFGMSIIEASAMGVPILTTSHTGCVDTIIENVTGEYIERDYQNISKSIESFISNESKRSDYAIAGRKFVSENFDHLIIWKYIEDLYME